MLAIAMRKDAITLGRRHGVSSFDGGLKVCPEDRMLEYLECLRALR